MPHLIILHHLDTTLDNRTKTGRRLIKILLQDTSILGSLLTLVAICCRLSR